MNLKSEEFIDNDREPFAMLNDILNKPNNTENTPSEKIPFWSENPNVLFDPKHILEFFPIEPMSYNQKLNAVSRIVILLTIIGFAISQNFRLILVTAITMGAIYMLHYYHEKELEKTDSKRIDLIDKLKNEENFENPTLDYLNEKRIKHSPTLFDSPTPGNPFSNVLMTDYEFNPDKRPAPPSFNQNVNDTILASAKKMVIQSNPDQPDIADKLFKDLGEQLDFEQSLRQFTTNPATTIPNDQAAFAEFCYGSMISCKEGNRFACARNMSRHTNI
jgi:hypothetical protein